MKDENQTDCESIRTRDPEILTAERAAGEFCAQLKSFDPQIEYLRGLGRDGGLPRQVLHLYLKLMAANRPKITVDEARLLVDVLNSRDALFLRELADLTDSVAFNVETWLMVYGFEGLKVDGDRFVGRLRRMSVIELCSLIDSIDEWWKSSERSTSFAGLARYFNLETERGVPCRG
jgi:hypothetical protein